MDNNLSANEILDVLDEAMNESDSEALSDNDIVDTATSQYQIIVTSADVALQPIEFPTEQGQESDSEPENQHVDLNCSDSSDDTTLNLVKDKIDNFRSHKKNVQRLSTWQYENQKKRRQGKTYESVKKSPDGPEVVKKPCKKMGNRCKGCRKFSNKRECNILSESDRQENYNNFWRLDWQQKKLFMNESVQKLPVKKHSSPNKIRQKTQRHYYLKKDNKRILVCSQMFSSTLAMNERTIRRWTDKDRPAPMARSPKKLIVNNVVKDTRKEHLTNFLRGLPKVPSHYCRKNTSRQYLEPPWTSMAEVHSHYKENALQNKIKPLSVMTFKREYRKQKISVYRPRKDECDVCVSFKNGTIARDVYEEHILRKDEARAQKAYDTENPADNILTLTVDVQAVLICPDINASKLFYRTKLATHNYTTYDVNSGDVTCSIWNESEGGLTSSIFSTVLIDVLREKIKLRPRITIIKVYSDGCGYQNRCTVLSNALALFSHETGVIIEQYFLEKGHTQMQCDAAHAAIERRVRKKFVYIPSDYMIHMIQARKKQPFEVREYKHTDFRDYRNVNFVANIKPEDGHVNDVRCIKYTPDLDMSYKLNYSDAWTQYPPARYEIFNVQPLYTCPLPIKGSKYHHLQEIKTVIPNKYHLFYDELPHL